MCLACDMYCCASDEFGECGCYHCDNPGCQHPACRTCGEPAFDPDDIGVCIGCQTATDDLPE